VPGKIDLSATYYICSNTSIEFNMKTSLLQKLACPFDKKDLDLKIIRQEGDSILEGIFTCTHCNRYSPIIYGIPIAR
jgi:uncharacterized protein YbaR (Trm112 family)